MDVLRGIAVLTMIAPNLAAQVLAEPHPIWLRAFGSFAAPLFVIISGMMVAFTARKKDRDLRYFIRRGATVLAFGVVVDVFIWKIFPFTTVDILYLIGVCLPSACLFLRARSQFRWVIIAAIFLATPVLQSILGYTSYPTEVNLLGQPAVTVPGQTNILNHWLIDGWFPVFPWLGFSLLGADLSELLLTAQRGKPARRRLVPVIGAMMLGVGATAWLFDSTDLLVRAGYSELFYPPTIGYEACAIGLFLLLFAIIQVKGQPAVLGPFQWLGESSLFIYILHLAVIEYLITPFLLAETIEVFIIAYAVLSIFMVIAAHELRRAKCRLNGAPLVARVLLGR